MGVGVGVGAGGGGESPSTRKQPCNASSNASDIPVRVEAIGRVVIAAPRRTHRPCNEITRDNLCFWGDVAA